MQRLGRIVRADYRRHHGRDLEDDAYGQTLLLRILRAERSARWAARHLRKRGDELSLPEQKMLLDTENAAGEVIDKAMRSLGLDGKAAEVDPMAELQRLVNEHTAAATSDAAQSPVL